MNIGVFETIHFEGAYPIIKLFDNGKNKITVFTYENCFHQFKFLFAHDLVKYEWLIKNEAANKNAFIYKILSEVKKRKIELLYLNTVSNNYHSYSLLIKILKGVRVIITLHSINSYFIPPPAWSIKKIIRSNGKKWLIKSANEFNVVGLDMTDILRAKIPLHKKIHCLPGAVFEKEKISTKRNLEKKEIKIVVPGSVDIRRRNYEQVFDLLKKINASNLPVTVTILGGAYFAEGKQVIQRCKEYAKQYDNLKYYDTEVVDQPEFDRIMNASHFVWSPLLQQTFLEDGIMEEYGSTVCSGNIFDIIKHAVPFIIPRKLRTDKFLESSAFRYETVDNIINYLKSFLVYPQLYLDLQNKAIENSNNYTIECIRDRNPGVFRI